MAHSKLDFLASRFCLKEVWVAKWEITGAAEEKKLLQQTFTLDFYTVHTFFKELAVVDLDEILQIFPFAS